MKKTQSLKYLLGVLLAGTIMTACDNNDEDVPPPSNTPDCAVIAKNDAMTLLQNTSDTVSVLKNDELCGLAASGAAVTITQMPMHGQASLTSQKQVLYIPAVNYVGPDEVTYSVTTSKGQSTAKVLINVSSAPNLCQIIARPDSAIINRVMGTLDSVSVKVAVNDDFCPNNGPVTVQLVSNGMHSNRVFLAGTGISTRLVYFTTAAKNQDDLIGYRVCQGNYCGDSYLKVKL